MGGFDHRPRQVRRRDRRRRAGSEREEIGCAARRTERNAVRARNCGHQLVGRRGRETDGSSARAHREIAHAERAIGEDCMPSARVFVGDREELSHGSVRLHVVFVDVPFRRIDRDGDRCARGSITDEPSSLEMSRPNRILSDDRLERREDLVSGRSHRRRPVGRVARGRDRGRLEREDRRRPCRGATRQMRQDLREVGFQLRRTGRKVGGLRNPPRGTIVDERPIVGHLPHVAARARVVVRKAVALAEPPRAWRAIADFPSTEVRPIDCIGLPNVGAVGVADGI